MYNWPPEKGPGDGEKREGEVWCKYNLSGSVIGKKKKQKKKKNTKKKKLRRSRETKLKSKNTTKK